MSYLVFHDMTPVGRKTRVIRVHNERGGDCLGEIVFYGGWRQYIFAPETDTEFSSGCLREIAGQIESLNRERSEARLRAAEATP